MVSIHSSESAFEPKALIGGASPIITSHKLALDVSEPNLMEDQLDPRLEISQILTKRSSKIIRETKTAPVRRITGTGKVLTYATTVDFLPPEENPAIELEPTKGLISVVASRQRVPVPDAKAAMRSKTRKIAGDDADTSLAEIASVGPHILAPEDEPAPLKLDRPPTIPFPGATKGASFMLLVDTSGSVKGNPLHGIKTSALEFISLMGPKDRVGLMTFEDTTQLINPFTSKNERLKYKIRSLRTTGKLTVLNDSLLEAGQILKTEDSDNLHVVLFSDGKDEGSRTGLDQVVRTLKKLNVSVLAVGYTRVEKKYLDILRSIADATGGVFVQTPEFDDILSLYKSTWPIPEPAPGIMEAGGGAILLKSDPTDAQIYVNEEYLGSTPMLIKLPMGKYDVRLQSDGYHQWQAQLELSEPGEVPLSVKLEPIHD
jgi:Mg-chelatase subunit ChlD